MKYFGLPMRALHRLFVTFIEFPEVDEVIIYGSRAMGNYRSGSDIDIVLKGDLLDDSILREIDSLLDAMMLPYFIDLSLYAGIVDPDLKDHIDTYGKTMYKRRNITFEDLVLA